MVRKTKILFAIFFLQFAICHFAFSQTVTPSLIGSGGNYFEQIGVMSISSSIGEPIVTTLTNTVAPTIKYLTQGFQQPTSACPTVAGLSASPNTTICPGTNVTITPNMTNALSAASYFWSSGETTSSIIVTPTLTTVYTFSITGCPGTEHTSTVTVYPIIPTPTVTGTPNPICEGEDLTLTSTGAAGAYAWSGPNGYTSNVQNPIIIAIGTSFSGTYTVTETANGCKGPPGIITVTVNTSPAAPIAASSPAVVCEGQDISLTASNTGTSYSWSGPGGFTSASQNPVITPSAISNSGTYSVTTTAGGCTSPVGTVSVTVNPVPTPSITASPSLTICSGDQVTLTASGGTTYSWSPGGTGAVITPVVSSPTNFTVTATDAAGCSDTASIFVSIAPTPVAVIIASPPSICTGGTSTLTASGGTIYQWSTGSSTTSISVNPVTPTSYTVTAFNGSCFDTSVFNLNVTNFNAIISITNNDSILCVGDNAVLTASSGNSYSWSTGETTQSISISPAITTTYVVTISSGACSGTDSMLVAVLTAPTAAISALKDTVCVLQGAGLTASGGGTYQWAGGPATANYNPFILSQGPHSYSVTVSNGSCSAGATYTVFANPIPVVTANASPNAICPGDTAALSATANNGTSPYTFGWLPGPIFGTTINVSPSSAMTYTAVVVDGNGCSNFSLVPITMSTISVNAGADITICPGFTAPLDAIASGNISGVTYLWSPDNLVNNPTAQNPSASPVDSISMFIVTVTNGSCSAKDSITIYSFRTPECIIKIYNGITPNGDADNNIWHIDGIESYPENKVIIFNRWGTRVWGAEGYNNKEVVWNGSNEQGERLADGTYYYFVELYDGKGGTIFSRSSWVEVTR